MPVAPIYLQQRTEMSSEEGQRPFPLACFLLTRDQKQGGLQIPKVWQQNKSLSKHADVLLKITAISWSKAGLPVKPKSVRLGFHCLVFQQGPSCFSYPLSGPPCHHLQGLLRCQKVKPTVTQILPNFRHVAPGFAVRDTLQSRNPTKNCVGEIEKR